MTFPRKTEGGLLPKRAEDGGGHAGAGANGEIIFLFLNAMDTFFVAI